MSGAQKFSLSLLISVVVFSGFAVLAWSGLFDYIETTFYLERVQTSVQVRVDRIAAQVSSTHQSNLDRFSAILNQPSVRRAFDVNQAKSDIDERDGYFQAIEQQLPSLDFVRFVDLGGTRLHFSTKTTDFTSTATTRTYKPLADLEGTDPIPIQSLAYPAVTPENRSLLVGAGIPEPDILSSPESNQFVYRLPVLDELGVLQGAALFYVNAGGLSVPLVRAGLIGAGDEIFLVSGGEDSGTGLVVNARSTWVNTLAGAINADWDTIVAGERPVFDVDSSPEFVLFSAPPVEGDKRIATVFYLFPLEDLQMTDVMKGVMLGAIFLTVFLVVFLLFNLRQDAVVILSDRVKRFQISLLREYLENKQDLDFERWRSELEDRRGEVASQIRRGIGRIRPSKREEVDQLIDSSWDEILEVLGARAAQAPERGVDVAQLEETLQRVLRRVETGLPSGRTLPRPSPRRVPPTEVEEEFEELGEAEEVGAVEELGEAEEIEAAEDLGEALEESGGVEGPEEIEELGEEEPRQAPVSGRFAPGEPIPVEEITEEEYEAEELGEVEELEEVEELGEVEETEAVEEIGEAEDLGEAVEEPGGVEELGEIEEIEEPEEPEEVEELGEVQEPGEASAEEAAVPAEFTPGEPIPVEEISEEEYELEELGEVEELAEEEELEEAEELADEEETEAVEEIGEAGDLGEAVEESVGVEELREVQELGEASDEEAAVPAEFAPGEPLPAEEISEEEYEVEELSEVEELFEEEEPGEIEELGEVEEFAEEEELGEEEELEEEDLGELETADEIETAGVDVVEAETDDEIAELHSIAEAQDLDLAGISLESLSDHDAESVPLLEVESFEPFDEDTTSEIQETDQVTAKSEDDIELLVDADDIDALDQASDAEPAELEEARPEATPFMSATFSFGRGAFVSAPAELPPQRRSEDVRTEEPAAIAEPQEETPPAEELDEVAEVLAEEVEIPSRLAAPVVSDAPIRFTEVRALSTHDYEIATVGEILDRLHIDKEIIVDHDGLFEIDRKVYGVQRPPSDDETRKLIDAVTGGTSDTATSGVEELFGLDETDLFADLGPTEQVEPEERRVERSVIRFVDRGFDYDGFLRGFSKTEGGIIKSLVTFTRYWNARVGVLYVAGEGELVPRYGLGIEDACLQALRLSHSSGLFRNVLQKRNLLFINGPLRRVEYFHGLCSDVQIVLFQKSLFVPIVINGEDGYAMLGVPDFTQNLEAAFNSIVPVLTSVAVV